MLHLVIPPPPPAPSQWHFVSKDPLLRIRCVRPATLVNGGVIATAMLAPVHSKQRRNYRTRRLRHYLAFVISQTHKHTPATPRSAVLRRRRSGPLTLLTSCLDTYRPDCSDSQSAVRKCNNARLSLASRLLGAQHVSYACSKQ